MTTQDKNEVRHAFERIKNYIHLTPLITSSTLNQILGSNIYFKMDSLQKTGAFKVRGVLNHLLTLKEQNQLPNKVSAYSTGNHGVGIAYAAKILNISSRIYLPYDTSSIKRQAIIYYNSKIIYTNSRIEAENLSKSSVDEGYYFLHPSDSDSTIAGAGTVCYEALQQMPQKPDAIFASCGGGGLLSGSYLAKELLSPRSLLIGSEPETANDAYRSLKQKKIFRFADSPITIADGLKTLSLSNRTYNYLLNLDNLYIETEYNIRYWTAWLIHLLKITCEPSCAINMSSAYHRY